MFHAIDDNSAIDVCYQHYLFLVPERNVFSGKYHLLVYIFKNLIYLLNLLNVQNRCFAAMIGEHNRSDSFSG